MDNDWKGWGDEIEQNSIHNISFNGFSSVQIEDSRCSKFEKILNDMGIHFSLNAGIYLVNASNEKVREICKDSDIYFSFRTQYSYGENLDI